MALDGADLTLGAAEIHGVLGENGAGKTTLLSILGGMLPPDAGRIEMDGEAVRISSPRDAWKIGVGMVHQHFSLVPAFTVAENLILGAPGTGVLGRLDQAAAARRAREIMERTGLEVDLAARAGELEVGARQRAEILKALLRRPRILILDEPTAVLVPDEITALFRLLRTLAAEGTTVVLVAHKLDEVLAVAHRVTVLRRGRTVLTALRDEVDVDSLVRAMMGSELSSEVGVGGKGTTHLPAEEGDEGAATAAREREAREEVATLEGVEVRTADGHLPLNQVSLAVAAGEIVGVAGVEGNGQRELCRVLAGRLGPSHGKVSIPDEVGFVPQDRSREGLALDLDLAENVALGIQRLSAYRRGPFLVWRRIRSRTRALIREAGVRAPGPTAPAWTLSGGNQQKLVVARELEMTDRLLVAENPTRGLDVAAAGAVWDALRQIAEGGAGVVLVSSDLDEILGLAHRILVMARGRLVPVPPEACTREGVGRWMLQAASAASGDVRARD